MRISAKTVYGVRALLDLAMHMDNGPTLSRDIAQRQHIPETYLNQLVLQLRRAGLITSLRGPHGGHTLAQPPQSVTVLQILEALEGPIVVVADHASDDDHSVADGVLSGIWDHLRDVIRRELAETSLADLRDRLLTGNDQFMYEI